MKGFVDPAAQEALEIERGDVLGTFKILGSGVYVDFYNSLVEMHKAPDACPIWEMLRDHADALHRALEVIRGKHNVNGNQLLRVTSHHAFLERRAYDLVLYEQKLIKEFDEHKNTSVLAHKIINDREFRMVYAVWRWSQDGAQQKSDGYASLATECNEVQLIDNTRKYSVRERQNGNAQVGVDSDAPAAPEDAQSEGRVIRCLFSLLRCGRIDEAVAMAYAVKQPTLAAEIRQYAYLIDPSLSPFDKNHENWDIGQRRPASLRVFKRLADIPGMDTPRRLLHSTISGHLKPLLDLATHTTDRLWSMANSAVINMLSKAVTGETLFAAPETVESIFDEIRMEPTGYYTIYGHLLREDWDSLITWMVEFAEDRERLDDQMVRLMGALATVARLKQVQHDEAAASLLFSNMIDSFVEKRLFAQIPFFASFQPRQTAEDRLLDVMELMDDDETRAAYLLAMDAADFDRHSMVEAAGSNVGDNSPETRVSNLRWLLMNGGDTLESAVGQVNCLVRYFTVNENVTTAREVLEQVAHYHTHEAVMNLKYSPEYERLGDLVKYNIEEFQCHLLFFEETHPFSDKFNQSSADLLKFVRNNPRPETSETSRKSGVASMNLARDTEKQVELQKWEGEFNRLQRVKEILKEKAMGSCEKFFKHRGYLYATNDQPSKIAELQKLRNLASKSVIDLLLNACVNTEDQQGIIDVAVMIAQPQVQIDKLLSQENLRKTLQKIVKYTGEIFS